MRERERERERKQQRARFDNRAEENSFLSSAKAGIERRSYAVDSGGRSVPREFFGKSGTRPTARLSVVVASTCHTRLYPAGRSLPAEFVRTLCARIFPARSPPEN
jgi:hypothetical protein